MNEREKKQGNKKEMKKKVLLTAMTEIFRVVSEWELNSDDGDEVIIVWLC